MSRSKAEKSRLEQLALLLHRKEEIEEKILAHTVILERAYVEATQELCVSFEGRMQDIASMNDPHVGRA